MSYGVKNVILCDRKGAIYEGRKEGMNPFKEEMAKVTNPARSVPAPWQIYSSARTCSSVSPRPAWSPPTWSRPWRRTPSYSPARIPTPEIFPDDAKAGGARVVSTGRSDFPNQINNVLAFPGVFRGAFDVRASDINEEMKIAAA